VTTFAAFRGQEGGLDPTKLHTADGGHPNAAGHDRIAQTLLDTVPDG
jgi:lysophospholipase L1-like esterase